MTNSSKHADAEREEFWEESDDSENVQESEEAHKSAPIMPSFDTDTKESSSAISLVSWLLIFLLKLQTRYFIPDAALKLLIKFFSIFFSVLGQFSPFIKTIKNFFQNRCMIMKTM